MKISREEIDTILSFVERRRRRGRKPGDAWNQAQRDKYRERRVRWFVIQCIAAVLIAFLIGSLISADHACRKNGGAMVWRQMQCVFPPRGGFGLFTA